MAVLCGRSQIKKINKRKVSLKFNCRRAKTGCLFCVQMCKIYVLGSEQSELKDDEPHWKASQCDMS